MKLHDFRRQYQMGGLSEDILCVDPVEQFKQWFDQLLKLDVSDPTAMVLGTVSDQGQPHQRIVLLKEFDRHGFTFFTNYSSEKAKDIAHCPQVSLHFPWHFVERQIIIQGQAEKISREQSEDYFHSRPIESQWAAHASPQSKTITSRQQLIDEYQNTQARYPDNVPLPDNWGGYRVRPHQFEFWQGGEHRLHDRFIYQCHGEDKWLIKRLAP